MAGPGLAGRVVLGLVGVGTGAGKTLAEKPLLEVVHYLEQVIDGATRNVSDHCLQDLLVSGAHALIVQLNG